METRSSTAVDGDLSMEVDIIISPAAADEPLALERIGDDAARAQQQDQSLEPAERSNKLTEKLRISLQNKWQRLQVVGLVVVVAVVWGLLSLPVIFYRLPQDQESMNGTYTTIAVITNPTDPTEVVGGFSSGSGSGSNTTDMCSERYTGQYCLSALKFLQGCLSGEDNATDIFISSNIDDQSLLEEEIGSLLFSLDLYIKPSDECKSRVVPFFCLSTFGLCGENGDHRPTAADCSDIRDNICKSEWQRANYLLESIGQPPLPDCSSFRDGGVNTNCSMAQTEEVQCSIECHHQFYCENNFCKPRCDKYEGYSHSYNVATDVLILASASIGMVTGVAVLVISCLRYKYILKFPTILVFYLTVTFLLAGLTILISYINRAKLYCTSFNLVESIASPSAFCEIGGGILYYVLLQAPLWWIFHVSVIFWGVQFPLHSKTFNITHGTKCIHLTCVVLALVLPLVPVLTNKFKGGYTMGRFPPILCIGTDADATFYSLVFPIDIILGVGTNLLIIIFWKIHKHEGLFRSKKAKSFIKMGTPQRKILIVFLYYVSLGALALTSFTVASRTYSKQISETLKYFECQKSGRNNTCSYSSEGNSTITLMTFCLIGLLPAVNLVYVVNIKATNAFWKRIKSRMFSKTATDLSSNSTVQQYQMYRKQEN